MKTHRLFAHPQPWGTVGPEGTPENVRQTVEDARIGAMWILPHGTTVGTLQIQHQGLAAAAEFREALTDKLFEVARTPRIAAGKVDNVGALSGVAMLILYRPLLAKTATKRDTYGDLLEETNRRLLVIGKWAATVDALDVIVNWPDVMPKDAAGEIELARELRDLGVSLRSVLERLGMDYDLEAERIAEEAGDPMGDAHGLLAQIEELQARLDAQAGSGVEQGDDEAA